MMMKQGVGGNWERRLTQRSHGGQEMSKQIQQMVRQISRNASMAEGACVNTLGSSSGTQILNKVARSWPGTCCPGTRGVFH